MIWLWLGSTLANGTGYRQVLDRATGNGFKIRQNKIYSRDGKANIQRNDRINNIVVFRKGNI